MKYLFAVKIIFLRQSSNGLQRWVFQYNKNLLRNRLKVILCLKGNVTLNMRRYYYYSVLGNKMSLNTS